MKKKLEAELISIAHRILQLKHKEDVRELHHETQKLYEKLSVLLFVEEHFSETKPTIGLHDIEVIVEKAFDFNQKITETKHKEEDFVIVHDINEEIIAEKTIVEEENPTIEEAKVEFETPIIEIPKPEKKQISIDDLLSEVGAEPVFERVNTVEKTKESIISEEISKIIEDKIEEKTTSEVKVETKFIDIPEKKEIIFEKAESKPATNLNDKLNKIVNIGLNDKLAFEKQLFDGSTEDFNRVVSQISTFDSLEDAKNFIDEMVKPDYNDWKGKEEFAERFMEFVASKYV
ncbi:hypothetical protein [Flavobacterium sp.]|uniref:hypothetical protein n=1 Tax=Flavobacterium sp. TaxID=239 RepID=UPI00374DB113